MHSTLPPSIVRLDLATYLPSQSIVALLDSSYVPFLTQIRFAPRKMWTPWEQVGVALACRRRGLLLNTPDPCPCTMKEFMEGVMKTAKNEFQIPGQRKPTDMNWCDLRTKKVRRLLTRMNRQAS